MSSTPGVVGELLCVHLLTIPWLDIHDQMPASLPPQPVLNHCIKTASMGNYKILSTNYSI